MSKIVDASYYYAGHEDVRVRYTLVCSTGERREEEIRLPSEHISIQQEQELEYAGDEIRPTGKLRATVRAWKGMKDFDDFNKHVEVSEGTVFRGDGQFSVKVEVRSMAEAAVLCERERQREKWGSSHDDEHEEGLLARVGAFLVGEEETAPGIPGWASSLYRRHDRTGRLVMAAALIIAELDKAARQRLYADLRKRRATEEE